MPDHHYSQTRPGLPVRCAFLRFTAPVVILLAVVVTSCVKPAMATDHGLNSERWRIVWVADGDTVKIANAAGEHRWLRLMGVDTPEKPPRAKCPEEAAAAEAATAFVRDQIASAGNVRIVLSGRQGKYGRELGHVIVDGRGLTGLLLQGGMGRDYGGGQRQGWCP